MLHCHAVLVRHEDGSVECTDENCPGEVVAHDFVLDCAEAAARCCEVVSAIGGAALVG